MEEEEEEEVGKGKEEEEAASCWASVAQQSMSAGNVHHSAARAPSLLFSQVARSQGTGSGQRRNATAMCEKAQQGEHEELGKTAQDYIAAQQLAPQTTPASRPLRG